MSYSYYEFENKVKILSGKSAAMQFLPDELMAMNCRAVLLISGPVLNKIGIVDKIKSYCDDKGVVIKAIFIDVPNDSSLNVVEQLVKLFRFNGCDSIVAIGGGSVIDTAKGVKLVLEQNGTSLRDMMGLDMVKHGREVPFIVLPTTSGTGSEVTRVTVISDTDKGVKLEFGTADVMPNVCILDTELTVTLPPRATLLTAFDALSHAIEAYTSTQKNPLSDTMAILAIDKIHNYIKTAVMDGGNIRARRSMSLAATLAGLSFSNSMVGAVHAIGHALGGECHIAHDQAMALLLPPVMKFNYSHVGYLYGELLFYLVDESVYASTDKNERGYKTISAIREMYIDLATMTNAAKSLKELGVKREQFDNIIHKALRDGARLANVKDFNADDVRAILNEIYE